MMYFPMRSAVSRLGGIGKAAATLGVGKEMVAAWVAPTRRTRPEPEVLGQLSACSAIPLEAFERYYRNLQVYREVEFFRRRRPEA